METRPVTIIRVVPVLFLVPPIYFRRVFVSKFRTLSDNNRTTDFRFKNDPFHPPLLALLFHSIPT